jgi:hypothetical protein
MYCTVALIEFTLHVFDKMLEMTTYSLERTNPVHRSNNFSMWGIFRILHLISVIFCTFVIVINNLDPK